MHAVQLTALNACDVSTVSKPVPQPGEVLIALKAAALNHRDLWIKKGQYAGIKYPCIPGSDGAGIVMEVADHVDSSWIGKEVIINPAFNWGDKQSAQSDQFTILGLPRFGTLAEFICVPVTQLEVKPRAMSWVEAAAIPLAGLTAWRALTTRAQLKVTDKVLISGIGGGVAVFALQFAVALGASVWVTSSSTEKIAHAVKLGAKGGFLYTQKGWTDEATKQLGGFDVIIDSAGGDGLNDLIDVASSGARIAFYGATRGNPSSVTLRKIFWRQLSLLGTTMGSPSDWKQMIAFVDQKSIKPVVSKVYLLSDAMAAFSFMEQSAQFGKIVLKIND
jgi:NADPH:quinone reductase-like Zn-dependent oxidoreductase